MSDESKTEEEGFIDEFKRISSTKILEDYEKKNRERIAEASLIVKDAFDKQWKKVTGNSYYQPVTSVRPMIVTHGKNNTERSDPRSRRYRTNETFSEIYWQKIRRKILKRFKDLFIISGKVAETGNKRPIFQNLEIDRLRAILGTKTADKILAESKKIDHGEVKGSFDLEVEGYWEVIFSPKKSENDPVDVKLHWEGQCLIIKRMKEVVLPGFYLEVADNATRDHYTQTPEQGRKKIGVIQEFPYTALREATMEEYLSMKSAGDKIMRDKIAREEGAN